MNSNGESVLWGEAGWCALFYALTVHAPFLAEASRKTTEQIQCLEQTFPAGLYTTAEKVS